MKKSNKVLLIIVVSIFVLALANALISRINYNRHLFALQSKLTITSDSGRVIGSGGKNFNATVFALSAFKNFEFNSFGNIEIQAGAKPQVVINGDAEYMKYIKVAVVGDKLVIDSDESITRRWHDKKINIKIITPEPLNSIAINGAAELVYKNIATTVLQLKVFGATHAYLAGKTAKLNLAVAGVGDIQAKDLIAQDVTATISGMAHVKVYTTNSLAINISGMSNITYYGNPKNITKDVFGMASVNSANE